MLVGAVEDLQRIQSSRDLLSGIPSRHLPFLPSTVRQSGSTPFRMATPRGLIMPVFIIKCFWSSISSKTPLVHLFRRIFPAPSESFAGMIYVNSLGDIPMLNDCFDCDDQLAWFSRHDGNVGLR